ncbi:hypothetical protein PLEOSDRAFT_1089318 [Pleurotus ostreatus PC15]|uniref:Uncharacterized protein n=1 Tax=Pleurotus ostreatus (strain PC15) TaxID=1137138 RepID=A0A067NHT0_PLEO1|nr:hypothetical protein PLEOSDRAFT_1089318 [Pleurotus ostreatus PC15]
MREPSELDAPRVCAEANGGDPVSTLQSFRRRMWTQDCSGRSILNEVRTSPRSLWLSSIQGFTLIERRP